MHCCCPASKRRGITEALRQTLINECESFVGTGPTASFGLGSYPRGMDAGTVLAQVDAALAAAEAEGANALREAHFVADEETPKTADEWAQLIRRPSTNAGYA